MGKRKSSKKAPVKAGKMKPLDKSFRCLFCQHNGTVMCRMDKSEMQGKLECKNCSQKYSAPINHLSEPIDVYSCWIDASDEANRPEEEEPVYRRHAGTSARKDVNEDDLDADAIGEDDDEDHDAYSAQRQAKKSKHAARDDDDDHELPEALGYE